MIEDNTYLVLSNKNNNQARAISVIRSLEEYNIPYKETNKGIVVLMSEEEFKKKMSFFYENRI